MGLDIRIPVGLLFAITGAMMTIYGICTRGNAIYTKSLDVNINLYWGLAMLGFGAVMYLLGRMPKKPHAPATSASQAEVNMKH